MTATIGCTAMTARWSRRLVKSPLGEKIFACATQSLFQKCQSGRELDWGLCDFNFQVGVLPD